MYLLNSDGGMTRLSMRKTNKSALHFINEVAGKSRLYIIFLLLVQMVLGISSVFYALLLRGLIDGAVALTAKNADLLCPLCGTCGGADCTPGSSSVLRRIR